MRDHVDTSKTINPVVVAFEHLGVFFFCVLALFILPFFCVLVLYIFCEIRSICCGYFCVLPFCWGEATFLLFLVLVLCVLFFVVLLSCFLAFLSGGVVGS